mmetsp:Transcript_16911/g.32023  ORF Transcript_16911/g.32023 Transcript_16911/m.32023 type:complete len:268 (-) Transcript_16911:25-828(-)
MVNVLACGVAANKGNCLNFWSIADKVHTIHTAVDDVEHAIRKACFLCKLSKEHGGPRCLLRGFEHHRVTSGHSNGEHPKRDHRWEVERTDSGHNTEGLADGICINTVGKPLDSLSHHVRSDVGSGFNHLEAAENITLGIGKGLAIFERDRLGQGHLVVPDELLEAQKDTLTHHHRGVPPRFRCSRSGVDRCLHLGLSCLWHASHNFLCRRVVYVNPVLGFRFDKLAIDKQLSSADVSGSSRVRIATKTGTRDAEVQHGGRRISSTEK